jgi:cysteinyl-tRNA synthetase
LVRARLGSATGEDTDPDWIVKLDEYRDRFVAGMDDDFNTPRAIATLFDLSRELNTLLNSGQPVSRATLEAMDSHFQTLGSQVLGILFEGQASGAATEADSDLVDGLVRMLLDFRKEARQNGDWAAADAIRDRLGDMGIALEDGPEGTRWRLGR